MNWLTFDGESTVGVDSGQLVDGLTAVRTRVGDHAVGKPQRRHVLAVRQMVSLAVVQFLAVLVPVNRRRRVAGVYLAPQYGLRLSLGCRVGQRVDHLRRSSAFEQRQVYIALYFSLFLPISQQL